MLVPKSFVDGGLSSRSKAQADALSASELQDGCCGQDNVTLPSPPLQRTIA